MHVKNLFLNFFYMGLDRVIGELMYRFQGRDNNIICGLGEIYLGENVKTDQFETRSFSNVTIDSEKNFLKDHTDIHAKTASDLVNVLFEQQLFTFLPQLS